MVEPPPSQIRTRRRRLARDAAGGIGVIAALALPVALGAMGLAYDANRGLAQHIVNQRAADLAALGAAMAYKANAATTLLQPTARDIVVANGLTGATVTADVVNNYPTAGSTAVRVRVSTPMAYTLGRMVGTAANYTVVATAYASLATAAAYATPCLLALANTSDAFATSGGASISASTCSVAAVGSFDNEANTVAAHDIIAGNGNITNNYGTLTAQSLRYAGSFNNPSWNTAVPTADKRFNQATALTDPWATSTELSDARRLLGSYTTVPTLLNPPTHYGDTRDYAFNYSPAAWVAAYRTSYTSASYVLPTGTYHIGAMSVGGGISVTFGDGSNIYIDNGFSNGGASVNFGNSNVYVNGGFDTGRGGVTIGNGTLWIGSGTNALHGSFTKGNGDVTINSAVSVDGGSTLTMGAGAHLFGGTFTVSGNARLGAGNFQANGGVNVAGGSEFALGDGNVLLGPASSGYAINLAGSGKFLMGDGAFSANGSITTAGGSVLAFGKTANHLINGAMTIGGAALFGAGRYTINGNFTNGTGGASGMWPYTAGNGRTYGLNPEGTSVSGYDMGGINVTFILSGTLNLGGGAKSKLVAASASTSGAQIADMLVHTLTSADTNWGAGAQNDFAGTVYLPNSKITMSGGSTTLSNGQCFTLIAWKILASGGTATGTACPTMGSGASGGSSTIRLVS